MLSTLMKVQRIAWDAVRSPRTAAVLKLGVALIGVVSAMEELLDAPKTGKRPAGFRPPDEE